MPTSPDASACDDLKCPHCGYDMRAAGEKCPECGRAFDPDQMRQLLKRRRLIGRVASIIFLASCALLALVVTVIVLMDGLSLDEHLIVPLAMILFVLLPSLVLFAIGWAIGCALDRRWLSFAACVTASLLALSATLLAIAEYLAALGA